MTNHIASGEILTLTAPYAVASGEGALVGSIFGVATATVANGAVGEFVLEGIVEIKKTSAQAWTVGALIYWDNGAKEATTASAAGANKLIGVAVAAAANPTAVGRVRLNASFIS